MRLVSSVFALAVLGCCFGPSVEAPPPEPVAVPASPLSQALRDMGAADPTAPAGPTAPATPAAPPPEPATLPIATPPAAPPVDPASVPIATPTPAAAPAPVPNSPACAEAQAAREALRAELRELRLTLGGASSARLEAAGAAMAACDRDLDCLRDAKDRTARIDAYDRAKAAHQAETERLALAEVGLYDADRRVVAACGAP